MYVPMCRVSFGIVRSCHKPLAGSTLSDCLAVKYWAAIRTMAVKTGSWLSAAFKVAVLHAHSTRPDCIVADVPLYILVFHLATSRVVCVPVTDPVMVMLGGWDQSRETGHAILGTPCTATLARAQTAL